MPDIEIENVVSCSSADKNNPAENLLKTSGTHKWKCAVAGEQRISCVLQLKKSSQIHSIDIGNEGSAFVEILVGKATAASDQDFEVLLVASSFMTPLESRNGTNRNAVRIFGPDSLNGTIATQKWDRVKVVCTQPFTKLSQYGLSFIRLHSPPEEAIEDMAQKKFGAFVTKEIEEDISTFKVGSIFASRSLLQPKTSTEELKGAAAIRAASRLAEEELKASPSPASRPSKVKPSPSSASRPEELKASPSSSSRPSFNKDTSNVKDLCEDESQRRQTTPRLPLKRKLTDPSSATSSSSMPTDMAALKRSQTEPNRSSSLSVFGRLMEGVVFVLSGFQNPYRAELRDMAVEMGATYRPDWGKGCTHLICAFKNTPKYQQVVGKGKIVKKDWIVDCYKQKKSLPWRRYQLGDASSSEDNDEEEDLEGGGNRPDEILVPKAGDSCQPTQHFSTVSQKDTLDSDSNGDTEDELRKVNARTVSNGVTTSLDQNVYEDSTDEDEQVAADYPTKTSKLEDSNIDSGLSDLFIDKNFYLYGKFDTAQPRLLTRYIAALNGEVEDYMSKKVDFIITEHKWDENFDEAIAEHPRVIFVKPAWIVACYEEKKLIPYQSYRILP